MAFSLFMTAEKGGFMRFKRSGLGDFALIVVVLLLAGTGVIIAAAGHPLIGVPIAVVGILIFVARATLFE
jgi:hypothetical protein